MSQAARKSWLDLGFRFPERGLEQRHYETYLRERAVPFVMAGETGCRLFSLRPVSYFPASVYSDLCNEKHNCRQPSMRFSPRESYHVSSRGEHFPGTPPVWRAFRRRPSPSLLPAPSQRQGLGQGGRGSAFKIWHHHFWVRPVISGKLLPFAKAQSSQLKSQAKATTLTVSELRTPHAGHTGGTWKELSQCSPADPRKT